MRALLFKAAATLIRQESVPSRMWLKASFRSSLAAN